MHFAGFETLAPVKRKDGKRNPGKRACVAAMVLALVGSSGFLATSSRAQDEQGQPDTAPDASPAAPTKKPAKPAPPKPAPKPVAQAAAPAAPASGAQLPNGASSITEDYGDWAVRCRIDNNQKLCLISQAQGNRQSGQRTFAIELLAPKDGKMDGTLLMPFGLKLDAGAQLKIDDKALGQGVRFSTCIPDGCLMPISFPTLVTDTLKTAKALTVTAVNISTGEAVPFNISLNGFAAAQARVAELAK